MDLTGLAGKLIGAARPDRLLSEAQKHAHATRVLAETGFIRVPERPDRTARAVLALLRWGNTPAAGFEAAAARYPDEPAILDEIGTLTFDQVNRRTNALAHSLLEAGISHRDNVAVMCRNHRGFIEATVALSKIGANTLLLNTSFAGPQLSEVVKREKAEAIIYDAEFADLIAGARRGRKRFVAWHRGEPAGDPTLEQLIEAGNQGTPSPPRQPGKVVILTSGTTGTPKGAARSQPKSIYPAVALLASIPLRARDRTLIAAPLFHSWGFAHFSLGMLMSSTYIVHRKFDPEETLAAVENTSATVLAVVPVMMQRILELPTRTRRRYDTSSLRVVAASGSALPGELATRWMDEFGDTLYNLYGSTEVAWATIATPADLRAAPGTAGRPPWNTVVRLFDDQDKEVPPGDTGRIFVANQFEFEGYTGGGTKAAIDGLMSTGDMGRFDQDGRLFIEGRDDEMIVSGGENVFPREVEDVLQKHRAVEDVALIGVKDKQYGQRLKAFVVKKKGASVTENELKSYVKSNLARYKVPREVEFLDQLPRNATGKVLKRELVGREGKSADSARAPARKATARKAPAPNPESSSPAKPRRQVARSGSASRGTSRTVK
ncbi:MAG TPA: AMP-binding protein [Candidatus Dormibacteraeota bacterium]|nr:AMP-binding protein [Candidatus Dormibacteraeota bacterium]